MADLEALLTEFHDECTELEQIVAPLDAATMTKPTPAPGWSIAHQIGHLAWTDEVATIAATDATRFAAMVTEALAQADTYIDDAASAAANAPADALLDRWRRSRSTLADALRTVPHGTKMPWFGPPMSAATMATARIMETWAHGQDVADALGVRREPTARLRTIAHLGVRTRDFAYMLREKTAPSSEFRVELTAPDGTLWTWGPAEAEQRITGPALDFCLLVTQRRHREDLAIRALGDQAAEWLTIAQTFAGTPGSGREPGQFD